ncbi:MAG: hypothetical protein M5U28_11390 [Sandaracinaceae bacterium]|nr:hypothetical protein [Sandaracinaceae bacterium]
MSIRSSELRTVAPPPARPASPEARGRSLAPLATVIALVALGGAAVMLWPYAGLTEDPPPLAGATEADAGAPTDAAGTLELDAEEAAADSSSDPANPFNARPLPDELREARRRILRGRRLEADHLRDLRAYQREHPTDPRPALLIARHHRLKGEWAASVRNYRAAHRVDPTVTGFRPMLTDLVRASMERGAAGQAARALDDIYGADALPEVERALSRRGLGSEERARLTALRDRLRSP